jgi:hypothetical protein
MITDLGFRGEIGRPHPSPHGQAEEAPNGAASYRSPNVVLLGSVNELVQGTYATAPYRDRYANYYKVIG